MERREKYAVQIPKDFPTPKSRIKKLKDLRQNKEVR